MTHLEKFQELLNDEWESNIRSNPVFATRTGDHRYNDRLGENDEEFHEKRINEFREFEQRLSEINTSDFSENDKLNFDIFEKQITKASIRLKFRSYRFPLSKVAGFHTYFPNLHNFVPLNTVKDYNNLIARLNAFPKFVEDNIEIMKAGIKDGQIPPKVTMDGIVESINKQITDSPQESPYFEPFKNISKTLSNTEISKIKEEGSKAILESINLSLRKLIEFLENEYIPVTRDDIAATNLPNGVAYYQHCIEYFTSLKLNPQEIHEIGLEEVKRIRSEMEETIRQAKFEGSIKEFIEFLRNDSQFYAENPNILMEKTALVLKKMDGELPTLFKTLPRLPYGIRQIPDFAAPGNTTAYYQPGSGDGTKSGTYYVNTYDLKSRPLYEVEALSLHEAVPGHHLQIALQQEIEMPNFRRFGFFTAFVEGWGLYSERLGLECGFYQDPYSNFGRHSYEMWRACRLVVDTGMHALGWSRQKAIDFMAENTSLSLLNITNEIDRYIAWPGQALAYKLGEIKIRELRAHAEKELQEKFDIREFHDAVLLSGSLPLDVLENKINTWIEKLKN
ncbi:MAG: hypothetical protein HeimC2_05520 [Candidatus Heimdallarchaeota archaeon LC_2]|nr:MAG: hypothetical protein HeimC2_05520 [Candidatus Heimdallarchaeota archaeon LC_2]